MKARRSQPMASGLSRYIDEISAAPRLTAEEEHELFRGWHERGDEACRQKILASNLRYVVAIAMRYMNPSISLEDLIEEGNVGLLVAFDKYEPDKGIRFITYGAFWIKALVLRTVTRVARNYRTGSGPYASQIMFKLKKEQARSLCLFGDDDEVCRDLAAKMNLSEDQVREFMQVLDTVNVSLDAPALGAENVTTKDMLEDLRPSPEDQAFGLELKELADEILAGAMTVLTTRERTIIQKRLLDEDQASLAEVGETLGVTRERVRQIEERAVAKLRSYVKRSGIFKTKMFS